MSAAALPVTIEVTQAHIDAAAARRRLPGYDPTRHCAVITAIRESGFPDASGGYSFVRLNGVQHNLPKAAFDLAMAFDGITEQAPRPVTFQITETSAERIAAADCGVWSYAGY